MAASLSYVTPGSYTGVISSSRSFAMRSSGIVGVSSRQCGDSLSCTIRRNRNRSSEMTRTLKPMIFSLRTAVDAPAAGDLEPADTDDAEDDERGREEEGDRQPSRAGA